MTVENLIRLFEIDLENGRMFDASTKDRRYMEFKYNIEETGRKTDRLFSESLGKISILCEFDDSDYYDGWTESVPFGIRYFVKYDPYVDGINSMKFEIKSEIFSRLLTAFRIKERKSASEKEKQNLVKFEKQIDKIENSYKIEISPLKRSMLCEKSRR